MTAPELLARLEALGSAATRKSYARHGVQGPMFGVSPANLDSLKKQIKIDQPLAEALWASGNHDARLLATLIADTDSMPGSKIHAWAKDLDNFPLTDALARLAARSPYARRLMETWMAAKSEWLATAGWTLAAVLAGDPKVPRGVDFADLLTRIESGIRTAKHRVRHAMNNALIAIGLRDDRLREAALAVARRIGPVEVDLGNTDCKTPDATSSLAKAASRRAKPAAKR
ncbi:MAG: DNA alkylation repair protein [Isosphaeraceae bacterium]|jgi:3-methyladenine DNA glycosylase AlkD|nr:MAG: DNA alkylation repair protein [Isosphaeraceae bacterium]